MKKINELRMILAAVLLFWVIFTLIVLKFADKIDGVDHGTTSNEVTTVERPAK